MPAYDPHVAYCDICRRAHLDAGERPDGRPWLGWGLLALGGFLVGVAIFAFLSLGGAR